MATNATTVPMRKSHTTTSVERGFAEAPARWLQRDRPRALPSVRTLRPAGPVIAIGDVHGRLDLLDRVTTRALNQVQAEGGHIICLGDYIDRGPESAGVLSYLRHLQDQGLPVICLAGNHEMMLAGFLRAPTRHAGWLVHGGAATLESFGLPDPGPAASGAELTGLSRALLKAIPAETRRFLSALSTFHISGNVLFSHAGRASRRPADRQQAETLIWGTEADRDMPADGTWSVRGHVITEAPTIRNRTISIDTGAYRTDRLTAANLGPASLKFWTA